MMADSYEDWLRFQFFTHKLSEIPFADCKLHDLNQVPEDLSFVENKFKEYYGIDITLFKNVDKFIILSIFETKNLLRSFIIKNNEGLKEFLNENTNFVPFTFYKGAGDKFIVRGIFNN
jgi:hypothetical protein